MQSVASFSCILNHINSYLCYVTNVPLCLFICVRFRSGELHHQIAIIDSIERECNWFYHVSYVDFGMTSASIRLYSRTKKYLGESAKTAVTCRVISPSAFLASIPKFTDNQLNLHFLIAMKCQNHLRITSHQRLPRICVQKRALSLH